MSDDPRVRVAKALCESEHRIEGTPSWKDASTLALGGYLILADAVIDELARDGFTLTLVAQP